MRRHVRRLAVHAIGWSCLLIGVVGLVLPILPGLVFLLLGLSVLSLESQRAHRLLERLRARVRRPDHHERAQRWRQRVGRLIPWHKDGDGGR